MKWYSDRAGEIKGVRFGRLVVLNVVCRDRRSLALCQCDCGNETFVAPTSLKRGDTTSCGCKRLEGLKPRLGYNVKKLPEYACWYAMVNRCTNPNNSSYADYGGRGITVCDRWKNSIVAFIQDMGKRPSSEHSIDRIDNDGDYCPENCRWATHKQQGRNKSTNKLLSFNGDTKPLIAWAEHLGVSYRTLQGRIQRGWSVERTLTTPVGKSPQLRR